jgi:predicted nucleotidyltransferase
MKTECKIIRLFLDERQSFTIREISKKIRSDYRITHTAVQRLIDKDMLKVEKVGKSSLCHLNTSYYGPEIYSAEYARMGDVLNDKKLSQLRKEVVSKARTRFFVFLLFGSYAKGSHSASSDIDIMLISDRKGFEREILDVLSLLPLKTHALVFSEEEFIRMKDAKGPNVVKEAIKDAVVFYGIEAYHSLLRA